MREPSFWWQKAGLATKLLAPLAAIYGAIAGRRMARPGAHAGLPVLCVGNFTLGGAGKTPTVLMLAKMLQAAGEKPFCLSRGYGGNAEGPTHVHAQSDSAARVGDEALLLARIAPTVVSRDRVAGAVAARVAGASIGNACVFPAGPLRAPLEAQLARCDALLIVGEASGARNG